MKRICFVRHAKAEKGKPNKDFERKLNSEGIEESNLIGKSLKKDNYICDLIIASDSARTFQTAEIIGKHLEIKKRKIQVERSLYQGTRIDTYFNILKEIDNSINSIMFVGHNTTLDSITNSVHLKFAQRLTTAAAAAFDFKTKSWKDISPGKGIFSFYKFNKNKKKLAEKEILFINNLEIEFSTSIYKKINLLDQKLMINNKKEAIDKVRNSIQELISCTSIITITNLKDLEGNK